MRTLAIGDIHGCLRALDALLDLVKPDPRDEVVTLGDYIDRGPDSAGVINRLLKLSGQTRLLPLLGNHEQMMMEARESAKSLADWRDCGGDAALRSYSPFPDEGSLADVPDDHWSFLEQLCRNYYENDTHIFVHASVYADLPLDEQPVYMLRWEPFDDRPPHESGKIVVCGHTPQKDARPRFIGHAVCIDTFAYGRGGWLTCLDTGAGQVFQANQDGKTRTSWLEEYRVQQA